LPACGSTIIPHTGSVAMCLSLRSLRFMRECSLKPLPPRGI
jgi:hypothetical protein